MAKFVKVKISRGLAGYEYPAEYDPKKISGLVYDDTATYLIGVVKDEDLPDFLNSGDIIEITKAEAESFGNTYRPQAVKISNPLKIIGIIDKFQNTIKNSTVLTQSEKDALDPDKSEVGINRNRSYTDILNEEIQRIDNG